VLLVAPAGVIGVHRPLSGPVWFLLKRAAANGRVAGLLWVLTAVIVPNLPASGALVFPLFLALPLSVSMLVPALLCSFLRRRSVAPALTLTSPMLQQSTKNEVRMTPDNFICDGKTKPNCDQLLTIRIAMASIAHREAVLILIHVII
jgi:hypothetical protein